jgi:hypothetical protein
MDVFADHILGGGVAKELWVDDVINAQRAKLTMVETRKAEVSEFIKVNKYSKNLLKRATYYSHSMELIAAM